MIRYRDANNALHALKAVRFRDAGGVVRNVKAIRYRDADNNLRTVFQLGSLTAIANPDYAYGNGYSGSPIRINTGSSSVSVTGGSGSYTYSWSFAGGSSWQVVSPSSATTSFRSPPLGPGNEDSDTANCTITDTVNGTTTMVSVNCTANNGA